MRGYGTRALIAAAVLLGALAVRAALDHDAGAVAAPLTSTAADTPPAPSASLPMEATDLPPPGTRSLFDHLLAQHDGLPYPFPKLVALITAQSPEQPPVTLLIPLGRSLLKEHASFARPRILVAVDYQQPNTAHALGMLGRAQLFLGFVEDAAEIEVISYNEAAGRFEFQLVQNYCDGCVPRIVYARRAVCTGCHQGAAPIFPLRPWNETNAHPAIATRTAAAVGAGEYQGIAVAGHLAAPERFDALTDVANFRPVVQQLWTTGCGTGADGIHCRRTALALALEYLWNPGSFDARSPATAHLRGLQDTTWPATGFAVPDPDLANRDPLEAEGLWAGLRSRALTLWHRVLGNEEGGASRLERLAPLPPALDPLRPRPPARVLTPQDIDLVFGLAQFFSAQDVAELEQAAGGDLGRLRLAAQNLPDAFFAPQPFVRVTTLNALHAALTGAPPRAYCCMAIDELSPPELAATPPLALAESSPLKAYEAYCFACHRGNPAKRLDFMAGPTEQAVVANLQQRPEIREVLDWSRYLGTDQEYRLMPPADSPQRQALEQALAADPRLLEEMRKLVPGLFDF